VHILLATDADWIVDEVIAALGDDDVHFTVCREGRVVAAEVKQQVPDLAILDLQIGSMGGMAVTMARTTMGLPAAWALRMPSSKPASQAFMTSSRVFPLAISVTMLDTAMAAPQPKVLNLMSSTRSSLTLMYMLIMSPQTGLPTLPTPSASSTTPTFRGLVKCSITFSLYFIAPSPYLSNLAH